VSQIYIEACWTALWVR